MAGIAWVETEAQTAVNTAVAASAYEVPISGTQRVDSFNALLVQNRDVVPIRIYLDGDTTRFFDVSPNGGVLNIEPESGIRFRSIWNSNLSTTTAQTADTILFRCSHFARRW